MLVNNFLYSRILIKMIMNILILNETSIYEDLKKKQEEIETKIEIEIPIYTLYERLMN